LRDKHSAAYPVEYVKLDLKSEEELARVSGFGAARQSLGLRGGASATQLAMRVRGLVEPDPNDREPVLEVMQPGPVVFGPQQAYLFRVVQVAKSAAPASLDEVRDKVTKDWKLAQAHELAHGYAEKLAGRAREVGLKAAVAEATDLKNLLAASEAELTAQATDAQPAKPKPDYLKPLEPIEPENLVRSSSYVQNVGFAEKLVDELFKLGEPSATAAAHRVLVRPLAGQFRWVVAELLNVEPVYEGTFQKELVARQQNPQMMQQALQRLGYSMLLNPKGVEQRAGFVSPK
jgi:hypothetical protein